MIGKLFGKLLDRHLFRRIQARLPDRRTAAEELAAQRGRDLAAELRAAVEACEPESVTVGPGLRDPRVNLPYRPVTTSPSGFVGRLYGGIDPARPAVLFTHGWLQPSYLSLSETAALLNRRGLSVFVLELPHHLGRKAPDEAHGARFITGELSRTLDNVVRALTEVASATAWLRGRAERVYAAGFSLGGLLTALHACLAGEPPSRVVLIAPAARPAEVLLASGLTRRVRAGVLAQGVTPTEVRRVLAPLDLTGLTPRSAPEEIFLVAGRGDQAVPLADLRELRYRWGCRYREVSAGHISLWLPLLAGERLGVGRGLGWCRRVADFLEG
jgi:pimeloyl-ACP methyl ester carboxylesterase